MALVLEIQKGRGFYIKDTKVTVERIFGPNRFQVLVHTAMPILMEIASNHQTEILSGVYCQAGRDARVGNAESCKIAITAPPQIKILRDNLYEATN
jgi:hypothetical protein